MKTINIIILFVMLLFSTSCKLVSNDRKNLSGKKYSTTISGKSFSEIEACSVFNITLHKSNEYKAKIEVPEEMKDNLIAEVNNGRLFLSLDNKDGQCIRFKESDLRADIYLPSFETIDLSGMVSLRTSDTFNVDNVKILMSGASEIKGLPMTAAIIDVNTSGSSSIKAKIYTDKMYVRASGASEIDLEPIGGKEGKQLEVNTSGSSEVDAYKLPFENVYIRCSGASEVSLYPTKRLEGRTSGSSDVEYKRISKEVNIDIMSSGASSIKSK